MYSPSLNIDPLPELKLICGLFNVAETAIGVTSSCGGAISGGAVSGSCGGSISSVSKVSISLSGIITLPIFLPLFTSPASPVLIKATINKNKRNPARGAPEIKRCFLVITKFPTVII